MRIETSAPPGQSPPNKLEPDAERFHRALPFAVNADELLTLQQPELLLAHARLRANGRPGMFPAALTMAMTRAQKRRLYFEAHTAAQTAAWSWFGHGGVQCAGHIGW